MRCRLIAGITLILGMVCTPIFHSAMIFTPKVTGVVAMKIPEHLRIPAVVFSLEAVLLAGLALIFLVLVPH
jgi:hypothetical protein